MHPLLDDSPRQVIPRWRSSRVTMTLGELASTAPPRDRDLLQSELIGEKLEAWRREKSLSFATDLLASAIVAGGVADAREAAEFVLSSEAHASEAARNVALRVLAPEKFNHLLPVSAADPLMIGSQQQQRSAIREARHRTRSDNRNTLAWVDLSLAYASLGFSEKAVHAMDAAVALAPTNRYVLRSAARLFVHLSEFDRAAWVLRQAPNLKKDPWLVAAEIAVTEAANKRSRLVKLASRMAESSDVGPFHLSEVASVVGTLELHAGNSRGARRMFGTALEQPTDNAVAQAAWASRTTRIITFDPDSLRTPRSYEARAHQHLRNAEWKLALAAALQWMDDESFDEAPASLASFIASSILEDHDEALRILSIARIANPTSWMLTNNIAFSLASTGRIEEAASEFGTIAPPEGDARRKGIWLATNGLIEFRRGNVPAGRALYLGAVEQFMQSSLRNSRALAAIWRTREEALARTPEARAALNAARDYVEKATDSPELPFILARIEKLVADATAMPEKTQT